jgi:WD40 repeat protein
LVAKGDPVRKPFIHGLAVLMAFVVSAGQLARGDDSSLIRTFPRAEPGINGTSLSPFISPDGSRLCIVLDETLAKPWRYEIYDVASGAKLAAIQPAADESTATVECFSPDGDCAVIIRQPLIGAPNHLRVVSLPNGQILYKYDLEFGIQSLFTPDGKFLLLTNVNIATRGFDQHSHMNIVDLVSGKIIGDFKPGKWEIPQNVFSSDSKMIVTQDRDTKRVKIWNIADSTTVSTLDLKDHVGIVRSRFIDGDHQFRGICGDGAIRTWDVSTGKLLQGVPKQLGIPGSSFTLDGKWMVGAYGGSLVFENVAHPDDVRFWKSGSQRVYPDTYCKSTVFVGGGSSGQGDLSLLRVPPIESLPKFTLPKPASRRSRGSNIFN